jgi:HlyD family secretion protein
MSSNFTRLGLLAVSALLLAGVIAWAQDRQGTEPSGQDSTDVFNVVEGRTVVITSVREGTHVEKGAVVCELDPTALRNQLATQEIVVRGAEADVHAARIAREVAVMALIEYKEGTFRQEFAAIEGEIKLTEYQLSRAEDSLDWSRRMFEKGYVSASERVSAELALKHARFALEKGQSGKRVLVDYSKARMIKTLTGAIEAARAGELVKQAAVERERSAQERLKDQIGRCKVTAPVSGRIRYAAHIAAGAVVHDGQLLGCIISEGESTTAKAK